jgi:hypothetical protein
MTENIQVKTLEKVRHYLEKQKKYVYITQVFRDLKTINFYSVKMAIGILDIKKDKNGRIKLR